MYAWCEVCKAIKLFYYKWGESIYCCESCSHCEKFPNGKETPSR